jgi:hypothetical protein
MNSNKNQVCEPIFINAKKMICDANLSKEYGALILMCPMIQDIKTVKSAAAISLQYANDKRLAD